MNPLDETPDRSHGRRHLAIAILVSAGLLLGVVPRLERMGSMQDWKARTEAWDIDPGALFYTEVPQTREAEIALQARRR